MFQSSPCVPRGLIGILCIALFPMWLSAAPPVLKALEPRGAQRGQALKVTLVGDSLSPGAEISTTLPGAFSRLSSTLEKGESELPLLLQLKEDAPPGLYPIRVRTEDGLSNVLLFAVGTLPETVEAESLLKEEKDRTEKLTNDTPATAEKLAVPITVNGTLVGPDQDYYRFSAKTGERLVFEVDARRAGSAIDPVVHVMTLAGKELAINNDAPGAGVDARAEFTFAQAGEYLVLVHDAKYSDQGQNFYRLKIGSYPYAEFMFPLGGQRGKSVDISLTGGSLAAPVVVKTSLPSDKQTSYFPINLPASSSLPFFFRVGDLPELFEPQAASPEAGSRNSRAGKPPEKKVVESARPVDLPASTVMNGRIGRPGEVDRYRVAVTPSQQWTFEVEAASLGASKLLGVLAVYDAATNKRLALTELGQEAGTNPFSFDTSRNEVDPRLSIRIPKDVNQVTVSLEDLLGRGGTGFGYRLTAFPQPPDFTVELVTPYVNLPEDGTAAIEVLVGRRGYDGPIRLSIPDLPEDLIQQGGNIPAELNPPEDGRAFSLGYLTLTAKPGAKHQPFDLNVWAEATESSSPIRKQVLAPGMVQSIRGLRQKSFKAPWLGTALPMSVANSVPIKIELAKQHVRIVQGGDYALPWKLVKGPQAGGNIKVENPRPTASIKDLRVLRRPEGMEYMEEGTFHILTTYATQPATFDLVMDASRITGMKSERLITAPAVTVEIVPGYGLKLMSEKLAIRPGETVEVKGKIEREPGFAAVVKLQIEDLPQQVTSQEVVIPADQTSFRLVLTAGPNSQPGTFGVRVSSSASLIDRKDNQEFKIPDLKASLDVLAGSAALK